jgi:hypothetical protein
MPLGQPLDAQLAWLQQHARIAECNLSYRDLYCADSEADDDRFHLREGFNARRAAFEAPARLLVTAGWR